jgi:hypothetical protein
MVGLERLEAAAAPAGLGRREHLDRKKVAVALVTLSDFVWQIRRCEEKASSRTGPPPPLLSNGFVEQGLDTLEHAIMDDLVFVTQLAQACQRIPPRLNRSPTWIDPR